MRLLPRQARQLAAIRGSNMQACSKTAMGSALFLMWMIGFTPELPAQDAAAQDPFAGVSEALKAAPAATTTSWTKRLFTENFGFRKELMSQFDTDPEGRSASRQSVGFEILKKFSTATSTVA